MKSARQDYQYAQYSLAGLYYRGQGVGQDFEKAHQLYMASSEHGFPYAAYELGKMYRDGVGCEQSPELSDDYFSAAFWGFQTLEKRGHDDKLQYRIGWMLFHGIGTAKDEAAAHKWFERSAAVGNAHAQYQLAKLILANLESDAKKLSFALEWLTKAAEAGQDSAQYALGKAYRDGQGVEKDALLAEYCFARGTAAELDAIDRGSMIGRRDGRYGSEAIIRRAAAPAGLSLSPVSIEELFIFMVKEGVRQ